MVHHVRLDRGTDAAHVAQRALLATPSDAVLEIWNGDRGDYADNGDDKQEFQPGEPALLFHRCLLPFSLNVVSAELRDHLRTVRPESRSAHARITQLTYVPGVSAVGGTLAPLLGLRGVAA